MSFEKQEYIRILENGIKVVAEDINEEDDSVDFEFTFDRDVNLNDLAELYVPSPNAVIFNRLVKKGWVTEDGTTFIHFKMDVLENKKDKKIKFKYYKADSALNKGLETIN